MKRKLGIAIVGLGGAVGTTMFAGIELIKKGMICKQGLPLAELDIAGLVEYEDIVIAGWDLFGSHLANAAEEHDVLTHKQFVAVEAELRQVKPWPGAGNLDFLSNIDGENQISAATHRETIDRIKSSLEDFKTQCDSVVVINLASTEKLAVEGNEILNTLADLERALDENSADDFAVDACTHMRQLRAACRMEISRRRWQPIFQRSSNSPKSRACRLPEKTGKPDRRLSSPCSPQLLRAAH